MNNNLKELLQKVDGGGAAFFFNRGRSIKRMQGIQTSPLAKLSVKDSGHSHQGWLKRLREKAARRQSVHMA